MAREIVETRWQSADGSTFATRDAAEHKDKLLTIDADMARGFTVSSTELLASVPPGTMEYQYIEAALRSFLYHRASKPPTTRGV